MMTPEFLRSRHSVRRYNNDPIEASAVKALKAEITMINTHEAGMHFELVCNDNAPFEGFRASYGMFSGVRNYIAAVVDRSFPDVMEKAGYFSQQIVMKATALGLGTCYVGGTFDESRVNVVLRPDRKILFIIAVGYAESKKDTFISGIAMKLAHRNDRKADDFFEPTGDFTLAEAKKIMSWLNDGLEGLSSAPSSLNRQPVRIRAVEKSGLEWIYGPTVTAEVDGSNQKNLIDLGIGKFNFAEAAGGSWEWGNGAPFIPG